MFLNKVKKILFSDFFLDMSIAKKVAYLGIFLALSIAVNLFSIDVTPALKISFTYLLGFFAGTFFGPLAGFFILFTGDFLGILFTGLTYWLPTGINTGMLAFIPGAIMNWVKMTFKGGVYVKAVIACVLMYLLCTCGIGAVANYTYVKYVVYAGKEYEKTFMAYLAAKIAFASIVSGVNYVLCFMLIPIINSIKPLKIQIQ